MNPLPIYLPKETVSDDRYLITRLYAASGSPVKPGDLLLAFETSKATVDLEAEQNGYFFTRLQEGQEVPVGALAGVIAATPEISEVDWPAEVLIPTMAKRDETLRFAQSDESEEQALRRPAVQADEATFDRVTAQGGEEVKILPPAQVSQKTRISRPAQVLIQQHGLDPHLFDGMALVRREDVLYVLNEQTPQAPLPRSGRPAILVLGGGGHAKMCLDILAQTGEYEIVGILDRGLERGQDVLGIPVLGPDTDEELARLFAQGVRLAANGIGAAANHPYRSEVYARLRRAGFSLPNLVHPAAVVEPSATLGAGNQIMAGAVVGSAVQVGDNCIINSNAVVSHDSLLADNVHIAPGALLAGNVQVGADTLIGMGATLFLGLKVGSRVTIANGMNVFKNVPDGAFLRH